MKKLALLSTVALMGLSTAAYAGPEDVRTPERGTQSEHHGKYGDKYKDMTPEQRKAYFAERKAKWDAMSDSEKIKVIEEKRSQRLKDMDAKWQTMNDREKIEHVEKYFNHKKGGCRGDKTPD